MWMTCDVIRWICRPIICTATTSFFVSRALALTLWEIHVQRRYPCHSNAILAFEKFSPHLEIFWILSIFYLKVFRFSRFLNFKILRYQFSSLCFSMFLVQIWCLYLVNRLLYGVLSETTFLTKTAEHDLSLTSITFDHGWHRVKNFKRMRRIDARRGTENFQALFPTEFESLTKKHQGGLWALP